MPTGGDDLDDEEQERAALHVSIEEAERELDAGQVASEAALSAVYIAMAGREHWRALVPRTRHHVY